VSTASVPSFLQECQRCNCRHTAGHSLDPLPTSSDVDYVSGGWQHQWTKLTPSGYQFCYLTNEYSKCKIWRYHGGHYEECRLLGYKNPVRTSQETYYVSATGPSQLMLCNMWGVHGGDYEESRLLGYKNPVRTSQETHNVSTTESSQLMLCKIWSFHGGDYE
jgi:hypothetical protein